MTITYLANVTLLLATGFVTIRNAMPMPVMVMANMSEEANAGPDEY